MNVLINGPDVGKDSFADSDQLRKKLITKTKELIKSGVNPGEIYILSPYKFENSALKGENILLSKKARLLIYTAISRASALLHVFYSESTAEEVKRLVG